MLFFNTGLRMETRLGRASHWVDATLRLQTGHALQVVVEALGWPMHLG